MSNGGLFQLAARLARFTGNQTYADWADKVLDWLIATPLIDQRPDGSWQIWDGAHVDDNCTKTVPYQWSYNPGTLLMGAAYMYNYTNGSRLWGDRVNALLDTTNIFFVKAVGANPDSVMPPPRGQIMAEVTCETTRPPTCNLDQPAFKAFLTRWMAVTTQLAPFTAPRIMPRLRESADAAAAVCTGQAQGMRPGTVCGRRWYQSGWDGQFGVGEQMSALSVFQNNMIGSMPGPLTARKGGTSRSQPDAGGAGVGSGVVSDHPHAARPVKVADKVGAAILTALSTVGVTGGVLWMVLPEMKWFSGG